MGTASLKKIDTSPAVWTCYHCGQAVEFADDFVDTHKHIALHCPMLPDDELAAAQTRYLEALKIPRLQRILGAHLLKHPEDKDAAFDPESIPVRLLTVA